MNKCQLCLLNNVKVMDIKTIKKGIVHYICNDCLDETYIELKKVIDDIDLDKFYFKIFANNNTLYLLKANVKEYTKFCGFKKLENKRQDELNIELKKNGLSNNLKSSLCSSYIKFGIPNIQTIIEELTNIQNSKNKKKIILINKLREIGEKYDENIPIYNDFINNNTDINNVIKYCKLDKFLYYNTDYNKFLKKTTVNKARDLASNQYLNNNNEKNEIIHQYIKESNTLHFF